jgi:hypothetical protein
MPAKPETTVILADGSKCVFTEGAWEAIGEMVTRAAQDDVRAEALALNSQPSTLNFPHDTTHLSRPPDERRSP